MTSDSEWYTCHLCGSRYQTANARDNCVRVCEEGGHE